MRGFVLSHTHLVGIGVAGVDEGVCTESYLVGVGVAGVDEGVCIESYTPGRRWCSRGG